MRNMGQVLYTYLQDVQSLLAPSIAAVFIMGVFWKGATAAGGLTGLIVGFVLGMTRLALRVFEGSLDREGTIYQLIVAPNWLHYCVFLFLLSLATIWIVSRFTPDPSREMIQGLTYGSASPKQIAETRASWNQWDVIHSAVVIAVIVAFYVYFW
jgi:SSS family solute:Na+ symporter